MTVKFARADTNRDSRLGILSSGVNDLDFLLQSQDGLHSLIDDR
jgi:hypothetical protein